MAAPSLISCAQAGMPGPRHGKLESVTPKPKGKPSEHFRSVLPLLKELVRPRRKLLAPGAMPPSMTGAFVVVSMVGWSTLVGTKPVLQFVVVNQPVSVAPVQLCACAESADASKAVDAISAARRRAATRFASEGFAPRTLRTTQPQTHTAPTGAVLLNYHGLRGRSIESAPTSGFQVDLVNGVSARACVLPGAFAPKSLTLPIFSSPRALPPCPAAPTSIPRRVPRVRAPD